ncbi:MAG: phosphatase PAP2 family protein [Burkholderiales bacterium]|nr:phosphatase PAP2 family protein [Burkholderiales bacterium]
MAHHSGLDIALENRFYDAALPGFPLRTWPMLELVGHQILKTVPITVGLVTLAAAVLAGRIERLRPWRAVLWATLAALCLGPFVVTQLKLVTAPHCPWDLQMYGGYAVYADQWFAPSRAEAGRCLPSGHAGAGFSLLALYFAGWAAGEPRLRRWGLAIGIAAGVGFGTLRMVQGAHFLSHTLWAALVDWLMASLAFLPFALGRPGRTHASATVEGPTSDPCC